VLDSIHSNFTYNRRLDVLSKAIASRVSPGASILDVGCGDGQISEMVVNQSHGASIEGIDVLSRSISSIKVTAYDGLSFPFEDNSFDTIIFVDVLHHADDAERVLAEAARVSRKSVVIKDHLTDGFLNEPLLRFMDYVGNKKHGVALPYDYWSKSKWHSEFKRLNLSVAEWETNLGIYPFWCSWLFDRELHFIAELNVS